MYISSTLSLKKSSFEKTMQFVVTCWGSVLRWTCHRTLCAFLHEHPPGDKKYFCPNYQTTFLLWRCSNTPKWTKTYLDGWCMCCGWQTIRAPTTGIQRLKRSVPTSYHPCSPCCFGVACHGSEEEEKDQGECLGQVALEIPRRSYPSQFRRREPIRQGSQAAFEKSATRLRTGFGLHVAQTPKTSFSPLCPSSWVGWTINGSPIWWKCNPWPGTTAGFAT